MTASSFVLLASLTICSSLLAQPAPRPVFPGSSATGSLYGTAVATDGSVLAISSADKIEFWSASYPPNGAPVWSLKTRLTVPARITSMAVYKTSAIAKHAAGMFAFEYNGAAWTQTQSLSLPDGTGVHYTAGIALRNNTAVVGAPNYNSSRGRVYVLGRASAGSPWVGVQALQGAGVAENFGASVALGISGSTSYVLASAPVANNYNGLVYAFRLVNGSYTASGVIASPAAGTARFGEGMTTSGASVVAIGAPAATMFQGMAYLYQIGFSASGVFTASMTATLQSMATNPAPFLFGEAIQITSREVVIASRNSLTWFPYSNGVITGAGVNLATGTLSPIFGNSLAAVSGMIFAGDPGAANNQGLVYWYR